VLYDMPFQVPSDLLFLGRCIAILSGMCTGLNPEFNVFAGMEPFARQLMAEEGGDWLDELLDWLVQQGRGMLSLPGRLEATLAKIERGEMVVTAQAAPDLDHSLARLTGAVNRLAAAVIFAVLLSVGSLFYISGERLVGAIGVVLALLAAIWVLRG
jgi:predicted unusual protein kinase regulating ubiquinone biosynthesis (AarF/ABC1/UbiB family)